MIVCVCHNVSDKAIRGALDAGAKSMEDIRLQLNVGSCCGKCREFASTLVRAHIEDAHFTELRRVIAV